MRGAPLRPGDRQPGQQRAANTLEGGERGDTEGDRGGGGETESGARQTSQRTFIWFISLSAFKLARRRWCGITIASPSPHTRRHTHPRDHCHRRTRACLQSKKREAEIEKKWQAAFEEEKKGRIDIREKYINARKMCTEQQLQLGQCAEEITEMSMALMKTSKRERSEGETQV